MYTRVVEELILCALDNSLHDEPTKLIPIIYIFTWLIENRRHQFQCIFPFLSNQTELIFTTQKRRSLIIRYIFSAHGKSLFRNFIIFVFSTIQLVRNSLKSIEFWEWHVLEWIWYGAISRKILSQHWNHSADPGQA